MAERKAARRAAKAHKKRNKQKRGKNKLFFRLVWLMMVLFIGLRWRSMQSPVSTICWRLDAMQSMSRLISLKGPALTRSPRCCRRPASSSAQTFFKLYSAMTKPTAITTTVLIS